MSKTTENSHGTAKKLYTGAVISAIATTGLVGTIGTAQADTVELPLPTTAQTEPALVEKEAPKKTEVKVPTKEVTQGQVDVAKDKLDKSTQAVEDAQAKTDQAQTEKDNAQSEVDNAQQAKDKATPENIEKQKQSVASAGKGKTDVEKQEKNAENDLAKAKEVVADQENVVKKSEDKVASAENEVKDAQTNVDSAQDILDGTGQADIIAEKENAEKVQKQAQKYVEKKLEDLSVAQKHDQDLAQSIVDAENVLRQAISKTKGTESTLDKAKEQAQRTQDALEQAQSVFEKTENDYNSINTFKFTDDYVNALKMYAQSPYDILTQYDLWSKHNSEQKIKLQQANQENIGLNKYKSNLNDKQIIVDPNNLTKEQITELSLFASDLLNQIRERFGTNKTVVSKGMLEVAKKVTDGYVSDNWKFGAGHDNRAVNDVAREYGLPAPSGNNGQHLENLDSINDGNLIHNMDDAKKWIYESLLDLLFNGYEWLHAESITGLSSKSLGTKDYFALGLSKRDGVTSSHWLSVADGLISGTKFNKTEIPNPKSSEAITRAYNAAKTNLNIAQTNNFVAQREKTEAATANIVANGEKENAQKRLNELKDTSLEVPNAEVQLKNAQKELKKANKRFETAQKALENLTSDVKIKQENLTNAKNVLAQKEANLTNAKTSLATEQDKLTELKALVQTAENNLKLAKEKVEQATKTLEEAKADLESLLNAEPNLAKAKEILAQKETILNQKVTALKEAQAILDELLKEQKLDQEAYDKLFALYSEQVEAKRLADLEAKRKELEYLGYKPVPVVDGKGNVVDYKAEKVTVGTKDDKTYQAPAQATNAKAESKKQLPNTGTKESNLLSVLGASFGLLALVGKRKYNR